MHVCTYLEKVEKEKFILKWFYFWSDQVIHYYLVIRISII